MDPPDLLDPGDDGRADGRAGEFVQSLERGLAVLRAFTPARSQLTLTEVARATGLTRAAARRFLLTLVDLGYVTNDGREFALRPRVLELGYAYLAGLTLPAVAQAHLEALVERVNESSSISVLDGDDIVYVARCPTQRILTAAIAVGTRLPADCTAMGRVLLAARPRAELDAYLARVPLVARTARTCTDSAVLRSTLERVAADGYALVDQELEDGLVSIAVPIRDAAGTVTAACNLSANALRVDGATLERDVLPDLRATTARIEHDLAAAVPSPASAPAPAPAPAAAPGEA